MSAWDIIQVRVVTIAKGAPDAAGNQVAAPVDVPGSPFRARMYRPNSSSGYSRSEQQPGAATVETRRVLSFLDVDAVRVVKNGSTVLIPACQGNGYEAETVHIDRVRPYGPSVQCDLLSRGDKPK